jgi:hypothetical protein
MGCIFAALGISAAASSTVQPTNSSPYYGRWTVSEERPVYTARGRVYKTIDIAPCGRDFCGVSVADNGACGATLFRFLGSHRDGLTQLRGHGRWGNERKNVTINVYDNGDRPVVHTIDLYLGEGYDFGERSDNMPKFHGEYRRLGAARCSTR